MRSVRSEMDRCNHRYIEREAAIAGDLFPLELVTDRSCRGDGVTSPNVLDPPEVLIVDENTGAVIHGDPLHLQHSARENTCDGSRSSVRSDYLVADFHFPVGGPHGRGQNLRRQPGGARRAVVRISELDCHRCL
jgi:hypothetical protein